MKQKDRYLWIALTGLLVFSIGSILNLYSGHLATLIITYAPFALVLAHAYRASKIRGINLLALAALTGFVAEAVSLNYVTLFGGHYSYADGIKIFKVPISVIVNWAVFIYIGYWLVDSFKRWLKIKSKSVFWFAVANGLVVTGIDLIMDPVQVKAGTWTWLSDGPYFHIPTGNFLGWFGVTALTTATYMRFLHTKRGSANDSVYLLPVIGYLIACIYFILLALKYHLVPVAVVGCFIAILPIVNLLCFQRYKRISLSP